MMQNKFVFGITGGSGVGKTLACKEFSRLGAEIIDCDVLAREVVMPGEECLLELCDAFGDILNPDGTLNRRLLSDMVFSDEKKLAILSGITHKHIAKRVSERIKNSQLEIIGVDGAVIFGSPVELLCEAMVSVIANTDIRIDRIMKRDGIDYKRAEDRILSQKNNDYYIEKSDYLVYNNNTEDEMKKEVREVWERLQQDVKRKRSHQKHM